jgi:serine/threonine protein kinase
LTLPAIPERLGQYQILRRLAFGGMAEVFLAKLKGADGFAKDVVIKRVLPQHSENVEFVSMFRDEARITSQLFHGNIVQVIEFGVAEGHHYLVLEYVNGPSLSRTLAALQRASLRLSIVEAAHIASEVARALDYAHRKRGADGTPLQVVHRDVTPSNILLSREGEVKLADFGIARARARLATTATERGVLKGKLAYMAPETIRLGTVNAATDLFALGAVLYGMLVGTPAFRADNEAETVFRILEGTLPAPSQANPEVPPELDALVATLLSQDPAERPERALHVADALARLVPSRESPAELLAKTLTTLQPKDPGEVPTAVTSTSSRRLLIVHESKTVRAVLRARLESQYGVTEASSAEEALEQVREEPPPDVVLCQRSGLAVYGKIRDDESRSHVAFVVLSSEDTPEVRAEAEAQGARAVVTQSLSAAKLLAILQRATGV